MVSSPVADLLAPKSKESYIEYKNAAGDTLSFRTFTRDGNKIVSLNGIEVPVPELFNIIEEVDAEAEATETDEKHADYDYMILPVVLITLISFAIIMLYMRYALSVAFG